MKNKVRWATVAVLLAIAMAAGAWAVPLLVSDSTGPGGVAPVRPGKRVDTPQGAIDRVFEVAAGEPGLEDFPRQVGSHDVRIPSGGPVGTTIPGRLETAARPLADSTYEVQLIMHWKALGREGATNWTYRVAPDGTVTYQGESGERLPAIK